MKRDHLRRSAVKVVAIIAGRASESRPRDRSAMQYAEYEKCIFAVDISVFILSVQKSETADGCKEFECAKVGDCDGCKVS